MRWNRARLAAAAAIVVALAAGCSTSSGSSATGGSSASAGTPKKGGTLTIIYQNEVTSLDPTGTTTASGAGALPYYAIYDALFTLSAGTGVVTPKIGQSLTANSAQTVWTLKLRPGVKFSDGTPYDAATQNANYRIVVQHLVSDVPFFNYGVRQPAGIYTSQVHNVKLFYDGFPFLEDIWVG